jgi:hypothetical protein
MTELQAMILMLLAGMCAGVGGGVVVMTLKQTFGESTDKDTEIARLREGIKKIADCFSFPNAEDIDNIIRAIKGYQYTIKELHAEKRKLMSIINEYADQHGYDVVVEMRKCHQAWLKERRGK